MGNGPGWGQEYRVPDQVPRLAAFRIRHPEVLVAAPGSVNGRWVATRDSKVLASEFELISLLDDLDAIFPRDKL